LCGVTGVSSDDVRVATESERGAIGWLLVGVIIGIAIVIFVLVQIAQAIF
jgi:hypothetical protein